MKLKVQAQHLQPGDIVGSGEKIIGTSRGLRVSNGKINVTLGKDGKRRTSQWGKYTEINIERPEKVEKLDAHSEAVLFATGHLPEDF